MQVFAMIKALEDDCLPSFMRKFNFFRKRYFESRINNGYLLSNIERYNEEISFYEEEVDDNNDFDGADIDGVDDDNDDNDDVNDDDTNLNNDGDDGTDFFANEFLNWQHRW
jgi:hypothetical protein